MDILLLLLTAANSFSVIVGENVGTGLQVHIYHAVTNVCGYLETSRGSSHFYLRLMVTHLPRLRRSNKSYGFYAGIPQQQTTVKEAYLRGSVYPRNVSWPLLRRESAPSVLSCRNVLTNQSAVNLSLYKAEDFASLKVWSPHSFLWHTLQPSSP